MAKNIEEIKMALASYGINEVNEIHYNPSYEELFEAEMNPELTGYEKGTLAYIFVSGAYPFILSSVSVSFVLVS